MKEGAKTVGRQNLTRFSAARRLTFKVLEAASDGLLLMYGAHRYQRIAINEGVDGIKRVMREQEQRDMRRRVREMIRRKLLEKRIIDGRIRVDCTPKGEMARLRLLLKSAPERNDGLKTMVVFDIPESQRRTRAWLSDLLRSSGCTRLQQSVWLSKNDIRPPLIAWIHRQRFRAWIRVYSVAEDK